MRSADTVDLDDADIFRDGDIRVWAKADLAAGEGDMAVSTYSDLGIDALLVRLKERLSARIEAAGVVSHARQQMAVEEALHHVRRAQAVLTALPVEEVAEELRLAVRALDRLVGRIGVEDVLGEIFSAFCLGK